MAAPRTGYLVHLASSPPVLVLAERDAKTYPGRIGVQPVVVHRGDGGTVDAIPYFVLDPNRHPYPEAPPLTFDKAAADARKAARDAAIAKLTQADQDALGLSGSDA